MEKSEDCFLRIEEAVKLLDIKEPTEIRSENGTLLVRAGRFMRIRKEEIIQMTARYAKADKAAETEVISPEQTAPLISHYQRELQA